MRVSKDKEITEIVRTIEHQGWTCVATGGNHIKATSPGGDYVYISNTPAKSRNTIMNIKRNLRRKGANI